VTGLSEPRLLHCKGVQKYYGAMAAVNNLTVEVRPGEVLGIGGPNGAGKTTLFDVVSGLTVADAGEILLDGQNIMGARPEHICHLGLARTFQLNAGFDSLTVRQNVLIGAYFGYRNRILPGLRFGRKDMTRADEALELVGMRQKANEIVKDMPVLDRKLLMIASALASNPKILLLDEPVGGLNPHEIDDILALLRKLCDLGITIVLIEHVMRFLMQLATRVMIMHHGEMIYEGPPAGLIRDKNVVDVYLGEGASSRLEKFLVEGDG